MAIEKYVLTSNGLFRKKDCSRSLKRSVKAQVLKALLLLLTLRANFFIFRICAIIFLIRKPPDKCECTRKQTLEIGLNSSQSTINPLKASRIGLIVPFTTYFQIYNLNWCVTKSSILAIPLLVHVCTFKSVLSCNMA